MDVVRFVDSISATPVVRLDLNDGSIWGLNYEGTDFSPPPLKAAWASNLMTPGEQQVAATHENRRLQLALDLQADPETAAAQMQTLWRELNRPSNLLQWQPEGISTPMYLRTIRSSSTTVIERPGGGNLRHLTVGIDAKPYAYGLRETLPATTVYNDPSRAGTPLNSNPYFETDASNWLAQSGTIARSTAQAHEGVASLLLTPDGVSTGAEARSENVSASAGQQLRASGWVRCAVSRTVDIGIIWRDATAAFISSSFTTASVTAGTWTRIETTATGPAGARFAQITVVMGGTPPASHLLYIDEATIGLVAGTGSNAMHFDITGVKGDVETPLTLRIPAAEVGTDALDRYTYIAVRRRGNPANLPFLLQAESMTAPDSDTSLQPNDTAMSGAGSNYMRSDHTAPENLLKLLTYSHPPTASTDNRGTYRVLLRYRPSNNEVDAYLRWGGAANTTIHPWVNNKKVRLLAGTGTTMRYADLDEMAYPYGPDPQHDGASGVEIPVAPAFIGLSATRVSGTGPTDWDCLLFLPADDRLAVIRWNADDFAPGPGFVLPTYVYLDAGTDGNPTIYWGDASGSVMPRPPAELAGDLPMVSPGVTNRVYWVVNGGDTIANDLITRTTTVVASYYPRYLYVAGVGS